MHHQAANRNVAAQQTGRNRQINVKCAHELQLGFAIDQGNLQRGRRVGFGIGIGIQRQHTALDTQLQRADHKVQVHIVGHHAGVQRHACALAGADIKVLQLEGDALRGRGQADAQAQLGLSTKGQTDVALTRGVHQVGQARWQLQTRHLGDGLQVQCQGEFIAVTQRQIQIDEQLVAGRVQHKVHQIGVDPQGLLEQALGLVQTGSGIVAHRLQGTDPPVAHVHDALERLVDDGQRRCIERLALHGA